MKYIEKAILLLACFSFFLSITTIQNTYAKYKTDVTGTTNISVARWRILVNNQDIRNNSNITAVLTPTFPGTDNIAPNVIAPTAEGYFDIYIDCSNTDVSFSYEITTSVNATSSVTDLITTGYSIDGGETIPLSNNEIITDNVYNTDNTTSIIIRIYIKWDDSDTASMNNVADTSATSENTNPAKLDVSLNFKQIA